MIDLLPGLPANVVGFKATGEVTREDFEKVVFPGIKKHTDTSRKLNFIFFVDTPLRNFSTGAWIRDIWLGVKKFAAWNKVAIVSDVEKIRNFTDSVSHILPGEYRGFLPAEYEAAVQWAATEEKASAAKESPTSGTPDQEIPAYIIKLLPDQVKGNSTEVAATVTADNEEQAGYIFERAKERVLDVNNWTDHCRPMSVSFQLMDDAGESLQGRATEGDFIQIDLPGAAPREGQGYDWARIEKVEVQSNLFLVQIRPSYDPQTKGSSRIAHFLEEAATSSFIIEKKDRKVTAAVFGRNVVPNTSNPVTRDKPQNGTVSTLGVIGLSKGQWKSLMEGLLERE